MRIFEVVLHRDVSALLRQFSALPQPVVLLGQEFGGAVVVSGAVPAPGEEADDEWENLRSMEDGPVGFLKREGGPDPTAPPLPGDILLEIHPHQEPSRWKAHVWEWSGPDGGSSWHEISVTLA